MYECLAHVTPGIVVFATHYGEDILDGGNHGMTLVEQTALTSRNITGGHVMNVLCSRATSNPNLNPSPSPSPDPNPNPNSNPNPKVVALEYPGEGHAIGGAEQQAHAVQSAVSWLLEHTAGAPAAEDPGPDN